VKINSDEQHAIFAHDLQSGFTLTLGFSNVYCEILVGIATRYGLGSLGIESRRGEIFHFRPDRPWVLPSLVLHGYRFFPGGKEGRGVTLNSHPYLAAEAQEKVEMYALLYSLSGPSCPVLGRPLPFTFTFIVKCNKCFVVV